MYVCKCLYVRMYVHIQSYVLIPCITVINALCHSNIGTYCWPNNRTSLQCNVTKFYNHRSRCHDLSVSQQQTLYACLKHDTLNSLYTISLYTGQASAYQWLIVCSCQCVFTRSNTALDGILCDVWYRCRVEQCAAFSH